MRALNILIIGLTCILLGVALHTKKTPCPDLGQIMESQSWVEYSPSGKFVTVRLAGQTKVNFYIVGANGILKPWPAGTLLPTPIPYHYEVRP